MLPTIAKSTRTHTNKRTCSQLHMSESIYLPIRLLALTVKSQPNSTINKNAWSRDKTPKWSAKQRSQTSREEANFKELDPLWLGFKAVGIHNTTLPALLSDQATTHSTCCMRVQFIDFPIYAGGIISSHIHINRYILTYPYTAHIFKHINAKHQILLPWLLCSVVCFILFMDISGGKHPLAFVMPGGHVERRNSPQTCHILLFIIRLTVQSFHTYAHSLLICIRSMCLCNVRYACSCPVGIFLTLDWLGIDWAYT